MVYRKSLELLSLVLIVTGVAGAQSAGNGIPAIAKAANRAIVSIDAKRLLSHNMDYPHCPTSATWRKLI